MADYTAKQLAEMIGTDGRTLRRFLRQDAEYRNPGSGGRWIFTDDDVPAITQRFNDWQGRPRTNTAGKTLIDDAPGLSGQIVRSRNPKDVAAVKALSAARVDRLEAALRAKGLHISQMREAGEGRSWPVQGAPEAITKNLAFLR